MKVAVKTLQWLNSKDPKFNMGETHTAKATLTNRTAQDLTCTTELYLDVTKVATSGVSSSFTLKAGASIEVSYPVLMSKAGGPWHVYLDVWSGSNLLVHYQATEDVTVVPVSTPDPNLMFIFTSLDAGGHLSNGNVIPEDYLPGTEHSFIVTSMGAYATSSYKFEFWLNGNLCGSMSKVLEYNTGYSGQAIPVVLPQAGLYYAFVKTYRVAVLSGNYYVGALTVVPITSPSTFSYSLTVIGHSSGTPGATAWPYLDIQCTITNKGTTTQTRKIAVWWNYNYAGAAPPAWYTMRGMSGAGFPESKDPGGMDLTLAPSKTYSYRFLYSTGHGTYIIGIRDDAGGKSAKISVTV